MRLLVQLVGEVAGLALLVPAGGPAVGAQGAVGQVELVMSAVAESGRGVLEGVPGGREQSPRPWLGCTCGSRHSSASSAWSGSGWETGRRHLNIIVSYDQYGLGYGSDVRVWVRSESLSREQESLEIGSTKEEKIGFIPAIRERRRKVSFTATRNKAGGQSAQVFGKVID